MCRSCDSYSTTQCSAWNSFEYCRNIFYVKYDILHKKYYQNILVVPITVRKIGTDDCSKIKKVEKIIISVSG